MVLVWGFGFGVVGFVGFLIFFDAFVLKLILTVFPLGFIQGFSIFPVNLCVMLASQNFLVYFCLMFSCRISYFPNINMQFPQTLAPKNAPKRFQKSFLKTPKAFRKTPKAANTKDKQIQNGTKT